MSQITKHDELSTGCVVIRDFNISVNKSHILSDYMELFYIHQTVSATTCDGIVID